MNSRLSDLLVLVSRVQEKRGDIRSMLRQDPTARHEVDTYLDGLSWLTQLPPLEPDRRQRAAGKEQLLATLRGEKKRSTWRVLRTLSASLSVTLVLGLVFGTQAATHNLPAPVSQAVHDVLSQDDRQVKALQLDLTTPAETVLQAAAP